MGKGSLGGKLYALVPEDGTPVGNQSLLNRLSDSVRSEITEAQYLAARDALVTAGKLVKGKGRGGSVRRAMADDAPVAETDAEFSLDVQAVPQELEFRAPPSRTKSPTRPASAKGASGDPQILSYRYADKRRNNPEVGMVTPESDPDEGKTRWSYDPHLDPALEFDVGRSQIETLIDDALASGDDAIMRKALLELKRLQQPYLQWTGKAERTSFAIDTVSLHVHERIDPASILSAVRRKLKDGKRGGLQPDLFAAPFENLPLRDAIDFYRHEKGWSNRLIAGDSLLVMNSLLVKEGMAGKVQMIYIDPPYGIKYGSNFQPFVNKRDVKDRKDEDLTQEPEMVKAFRDTWELGIHSYLTYLRDRVLLAKELLHETGSIFVQISDENVHLVRNLMDEVFSDDNFICEILVKKKGAQKSSMIDPVNDYLVWYGASSRLSGSLKFHPLNVPLEFDADVLNEYRTVVFDDGRETPISETPDLSGKPTDYRANSKRFPIEHPTARLYRANPLTSGGVRTNQSLPFEYCGRAFSPGAGACWKATVRNPDGGTAGMTRLAMANRFVVGKDQLRFKSFLLDFGHVTLSNWWDGLGGASSPIYIVQTNEQIVQRCLLMTTDPGDLVLDPTCGSGTTAFVAEKWGRRWITCDTSRVATTLAKQRLMTAGFDYYELKYPNEGLRGGFIYQTVPHVTLKSIANNPEIDEIHARMHPAVDEALAALNRANKSKLPEWEVPFDFPKSWPAAAKAPFEAFHAARQAMQKQMDLSIAAHADQEVLYDKPAVARDKRRITGPFSVEAVPSPSVLSLDEAEQPKDADVAIARSGESARQHSWRDELFKAGIRGKGGQMLRFAELTTLADTRWLHASGTLADTGERVVVSFGPEHAALEQRQVAQALSEAETLRPAPKFIIFAAFSFDPEAQKDIDETRWPGVTLLRAQMNTDLLTDDLRKARSGNQSFWLMGQPDIEVRKRTDGQYEVEVNGFDYFDTAKGELVSGGKGKIAMWLLDTDYDDRSLFPRQVFLPLAGAKDGWNKLRRDIKGELNEELLEKFHGTVSLPFEAGENRKVAVKIVDDRGIESLKIVALD